jgi:DNA-binding SARP family transcriptional activator
MMEPRVRRAIRTLLDDPGATDPAHGRVAVQALGSFVVRRGQQTVALAAGVPSTLVKLVASRGGSVSLDVAVEVLWPEVPTDVGRGRIRNVIARARELTGGAIERRGTSIAFIDSVELDVRRFEDAFRTVQRLRDEDPQQARSVARAALATYDTLLADDLYEQWADEPRSTLRRRASALIDLVSADDLDAATGAWLAELVTGIDPFDDGRLIHLAGILTDNGAVSLASGLLQRAADIANELGATG